MIVVGDDFYVSNLINDEIHAIQLSSVSQEDLTPKSTKAILDAFKKGTKPKPGPQSGRQTSENSAGLTALTTKVYLQQHIYI